MYAARMAAEARARGDEARARYWDGIRVKVDQAPLLDPETRARLAILLRPDPVPAPVSVLTPRKATAPPVATTRDAA